MNDEPEQEPIAILPMKFSRKKLDKRRREIFPNFSDFFRAVVIAAPDYGLFPHINHLHNIMTGKVVPGTQYVALFALILKCKVDDFFVEIRGSDAQKN